MLMRMYCGRNYGALQHSDAMVCGALTCNGMCRGENISHSLRGGMDGEV